MHYYALIILLGFLETLQSVLVCFRVRKAPLEEDGVVVVEIGQSCLTGGRGRFVEDF